MSTAEFKRGNLDRGVTLLEECARTTRELGDRLIGAYCVLGFGKVNAMQEKPDRAARLWGAAEALREQMGVSLSQFDLAIYGYERDMAAVRSELDEATFEVAWAEGRAMSLEQAVDYALGESTTPGEEGGAQPPALGAAVLPEDAASDAADAAAVRVFALGAARVERDGLPVDSPDWTQKPRELLYYLLSHPGGRTKEQIGLALWPEASTSQLRSSLHVTLYRLRQALRGKEWISFEKGRYSFNRSLPYYYDVEAFEENLSEARRLKAQAPERAIRHLREAADLYAGDYLEDLAVEGEWALARQEELRRAYGEALLLLGGLLLAQDRHAEAADAYRRAVSHDRFLEEAHRGLMRSQSALGERGRALKHYEELAGMLGDELGSSPAPETVALYESLRSGEWRDGA